jgi:hypothetical protein
MMATGAWPFNNARCIRASEYTRASSVPTWQHSLTPHDGFCRGFESSMAHESSGSACRKRSPKPLLCFLKWYSANYPQSAVRCTYRPSVTA